MRNTILMLFLASFLMSKAQIGIGKAEIDEFLGHEIIETQKYHLKTSFTTVWAYKVKKVNNNFYWKVTATMSGIVSVRKENKLMVKLGNNEILKLSPLEDYVISCSTCGYHPLNGYGWGLTVLYEITKDQMNAIAKEGVQKIRLYTTDGYMEESIGKKANKNLKEVMHTMPLISIKDVK